MKFKTEIELGKSPLDIEHDHKIITIGSCFAENIGRKFQSFRFQIFDNPFGVLYNPVSIYNAIKIIYDNKKFTKEDLIFAHGEWHSFYHHSNFSNHNPFVCLTNINEKIDRLREFLVSANEVIITFGTSFVYKFLETNEIVSNCHKIPAENFERYRIGMYEAREFIQSTVELLTEMNPKLNIILTLSPVRHWKDGATANQISKAILLLAIQEIVQENGESEGLNNVFYFPSYELVLDDLRDYRYYAEDLAHPNNLAIEYIWEKFVNCYCTENCKNIMREVEKIVLARQHRTRNIHSTENIKFLNNQLKLINTLEKKYTHLNLAEDKSQFHKQLEQAEKED